MDMKSLALCSVLGCATTYHVRGKPAPTAAYLVDFALFSAGCIVGMDGTFSKYPGGRNWPSNGDEMAAGYSVALAAMLLPVFVRAPDEETRLWLRDSEAP
jgi:hypothetical protein